MEPVRNAYYYSVNITSTDYYALNEATQKVERISRLTNLSRLNIFIGANNSGKSRLLREVLKEKPLMGAFRTDEIDWRKEDATRLSYVLDNSREKAYDYFRHIAGGTSGMEANNVRELRQLASSQVSSPNKRFYVPLLRGLWDFQFNDAFSQGEQFNLFSSNPFAELAKGGVLKKKDIFSEYFKRVYNDRIGLSGVDVFTGLDLYKQLKARLLGSENERQDIARFQQFLSDNFFGSKAVLLLPKEKDTFVSIKIGDEPDRAISELGDGIQNILVISFILFTTEGSLIFIEEPENTIHPGLQRRLIEVLLSDEMKQRNHQYFITSHSNHLLDLSLDFKEVSIYRMSPIEGEGSLKLISYTDPGDFSILRELGVMNSSVFLSNFTVWVEGITDRLYLSKFLALYQQKNVAEAEWLTEDIDYSFVEYGGNNIEHWSFEEGGDTKGYPTINSRRITSKGAVVADDDGAKKGSAKLKRHYRLKKELGERYLKLPVREIENILSHKSLNDGIKSFPAKSREAKLFDEVGNSNKDYKRSKIGDYIDKNIYADIETRYSFSQSGTITDKLKFAQAVVAKMEYSDMTQDARDLAKKLHNLILEQKNAYKVD
jgi:PKD repeat protein